MKMRPILARGAIALATVGTVVGIAGFMIVRPGATSGSRLQERAYNADVSRANLQRIHQALTIYRQESGVKPVSEWRTISDAGVPPHPLVLAMEGHPWTIPIETLQITGSDHHSPGGKPPVYGSYFLDRSIAGDKYTKRLEKYLHRGEDLIYLWDSHYSPEKDLRGDSWNTLVLRLEGTIEVVRSERASPDGLRGK